MRRPRTENKHPKKVCTAAAEGALFERAAVLDQEEHVEDKVKACEAGVRLRDSQLAVQQQQQPMVAY